MRTLAEPGPRWSSFTRPREHVTDGSSSFIPQFPVGALHVSVFPRRPRLDVQGPGTHSSEPLPNRPGGELRPVVPADVGGHSPGHHQLRQRLDHIRGPDARWKVCSETPMRRLASATVLPAAITTSASLNLLMNSSAVGFLLGRSYPPFCPES